MIWYKLLATVALTLCVVSIGFHLLRLIKLGKPADYSRSAGSPSLGIKYSFTGAMSPTKKESAFLHLPTYTAGIIYHLGTFLSIALFFLILVGVKFTQPIATIAALPLAVSTLCGVGILAKRIASAKLRQLSHADDYMSNLLVTLFQALTVLLVAGLPVEMGYYLATSALLLYFPLGKLKHAIYFFAARYQLGFFYGWRGVWPPQQ